MRPVAGPCGGVRGHADIAQAGRLSEHSVRIALKVVKYDGENSTKKGCDL